MISTIPKSANLVSAGWPPMTKANGLLIFSSLEPKTVVNQRVINTISHATVELNRCDHSSSYFFCFQFSENRAVKPHVVVPKDESDPPPSAHCYQFSPAPFIFHPAGCRSLNTATLSLSFGGGKKDTPEVKLEEGEEITLLTSPGPAAASSRKITLRRE